MPSSARLSSDVLISIGTVPLLAVVLGGKVIAELVQEIGEASEELFRGDRLPIIPLSSDLDLNQTEAPE